MNDLIYRQAAIDAVTKSGLQMERNKIYTMALVEAKQWAVDEIERLPSAQPEIIRCKDCKHYYFADNRIPQEQRFTCDLDGDRWTADSYCSFAERREE